MFKCIKCGVEKEKTEFHKLNNKLGHRYKCTDCVNEYMRNRYTPALPRVDKRLKNGKARCSQCLKWKPVAKFYAAKNKRGCQSKCRLCQQAYQKTMNVKRGVTKEKRVIKKAYRACLGYCEKWLWLPVGVHVCHNCGVKQMGVREIVRH